jgi:hypothetical protein
VHTSRRRRAFVLVCTALMTAACVGDGDATQAGDAAAPPGAADGDQGGSGEVAGSEHEEDEGGPLVAYLYLSTDASAADLEADERLTHRRHELIAACMAEQGFEYEVPELGDAPRRGGSTEDVWSLQPDEFVARYGYGITTLDVGDVQALPPPDDEEATGHPATLSPEEEAYLIALHGPAGAHDFREGPYTGPDGPDDRGCHGEARAAIDAEQGGGGAVDLSPFDALADEIAALWERIDRDPRVLRATEDWSACMADAGHPELDDLPDGQALVRERLRALAPAPQAGTGTATAGGDGPADDLGDDLNGTGSVAALAASDPAALDELRSLERSLAAAEHECRRPYDRIRWSVRDEHEHRFIEANRDELERYRDALATAQGGA